MTASPRRGGRGGGGLATAREELWKPLEAATIKGGGDGGNGKPRSYGMGMQGVV